MNETAAPWLTMEDLNSNLGSLGTTVGIRFTEATTERIVATMPVDGNTSPFGDAAAILAESVGSMMAVLHAGRDRVAVGVSISLTRHHPLEGASVTATCVPLHVGRTTATLDIAMTDDEGTRVASSTLTCQLRDAPPR
jgi:1,4-dihydroxy-2-naphthoyl-CoA hydrolase